MRIVITLCIVAIIGGLSYALWPSGGDSTRIVDDATVTGGPLAEVRLPDNLSQNAQIGKRAYEASCAACHGANAAGQDGLAPPLVHKIYEPSHHADESFQRAVSLGVRAHHWRFGDMAAVEGLSRGDVTMIIAYIRELQRFNGID